MTFPDDVMKAARNCVADVVAAVQSPLTKEDSQNIRAGKRDDYFAEEINITARYLLAERERCWSIAKGERIHDAEDDFDNGWNNAATVIAVYIARGKRP
jgi:hypothetical protein